MLHNLLPAPRPSAPQAHAADFHVNDAEPSAKPSPSAPVTAQVAGVQLNSKPVVALVLVLCILFAIRFTKDAAGLAAKHDHTRFREMDITLWNMLMVSLIAIPGIAMWKFFTKQYLNPAHPFRVLVDAV